VTHFVVILPYATPEMSNLMTNHFIKLGFAYWHWCTECWLLASIDTKLDAAGLKNSLDEITIPRLSLLVLRVDLPTTGSNWAWQGEIATKQNWFTWLMEYWQAENYKKIKSLGLTSLNPPTG